MFLVPVYVWTAPGPDVRGGYHTSCCGLPRRLNTEEEKALVNAGIFPSSVALPGGRWLTWESALEAGRVLVLHVPAGPPSRRGRTAGQRPDLCAS